MMFRTQLAAFTSALILASSAYSAHIGLCPDINDIKAEGLSMAEEIGPNIYVSYNISNYNTDTTWGFLIAPVEADSGDMALEDANEILSLMNGPGFPEEHGSDIICDYDTGHPDIMAAAISSSEAVTPMKLQYFFKKYG